MLAHAADSAAPAAPPASSLRRNDKTRFQKDALIRAFATNPLPGFETRQMLAETLDLTPNAVRIWFQNQRAEAKREQAKLAQAKLEQAARAVPPPLAPDMFSFLEHALSVKPTSVPDRGTKAPTAHMLSAVQRAAAYSAAMAYQAAMAAGMAEALAFGSGEGAVSAAPAAVAAIASPSQPTLKGRRRRSRAKGAGSFSWKPLGLPATYKRIHDLA